MIITDILITPLIYIVSFLLHEFMHIKSQGLFSTGTIYVNKFGMKVTANDVWDNKLFYYGGGVLSSIPMFIFVFATTGWMQWCFLTMGYVQLIYGIYEGMKPSVRYRYYLYVTVISIMIIIWMVIKI